MMRGEPWSKDEEVLLAALWPMAPKDEILQKIGRSWTSIQHKAGGFHSEKRLPMTTEYLLQQLTQKLLEMERRIKELERAEGQRQQESQNRQRYKTTDSRD